MNAEELRLSPGYHIDARLPGGGSATEGDEGWTGWFQDFGVDDGGEAVVGTVTAEMAEEACGQVQQHQLQEHRWMIRSVHAVVNYRERVHEREKERKGS